MKTAFLNLITKKEKTLNEGNPFDVIPIKNAKQAFECEEIHLGERGVEKLVQFDKFPNLEVLWLNDNKLQNIVGLEKNFRIKHLYCHDNVINTILGSINIMRHLDTLTLYNNELRGLDEVIEFLSSFTYLRNLDMFNNPLSEEPFYRDRVIHGIPQLTCFDRHVITYPERQNADKIALKFKNARKKKKTKKKEKILKKEFRVSEQFSKGEKNLYTDFHRTTKQIHFEHTLQEKSEELARTKLFALNIVGDGTEAPLSRHLEFESIKKAKRNKRSQVDRWEISMLLPAFQKLKEGRPISKENYEKLYDKLLEDEVMIGKIPVATKDQSLELFEKYKNNEDKLSMDNFEEICFEIGWKRRDQKVLQTLIDKLYKDSMKLRRQGKEEEANQIMFKASRLENVNSNLYGTKSFQLKEEKYQPMRTDYYNFGKFMQNISVN